MSNKRCKVVYNSIFIIVNCCTKIIKYIFVITRIDIAKLTKMFFDKIVLRFETLINIVNNKRFVFISIFWFAIYFYVQNKRQLSIVFYS